MNSISQNMRYLPHEFKTKLNAVKTYKNGNSIEYVCRKKSTQYITYITIPKRIFSLIGYNRVNIYCF